MAPQKISTRFSQYRVEADREPAEAEVLGEHRAPEVVVVLVVLLDEALLLLEGPDGREARDGLVEVREDWCDETEAQQRQKHRR